MNKEKQIEEMAFDICRIDLCKHLEQEECDETTCAHCTAEALYNAGYRKASEVAKKIFEDIFYHTYYSNGRPIIEHSTLLALQKKYTEAAE